jgi:hypothetical protein
MDNDKRWYLVRWYKKASNIVRTDWYNVQSRASQRARAEEAKGHKVTDYREVSGNGKRK